MAKILSGKRLVAKLLPKLKAKVRRSKIKPALAIIQIGSLERSNTYIRHKKLFGKKIGVLVKHKRFTEKTKESEIVSCIEDFNEDSKVQGIIVQLPIPKKFNRTRIIDSINPKKDVDGLTAYNTKRLFDEVPTFLPATVRGIITMLRFYKIRISGKKVVIVGRSILVGKPLALALLNLGATVMICHRQTRALSGETKQADILIVAVGKPNLITSRHASKGQTVIDVGINVLSKKAIVGDVNFKEVKKIVRAISPVPGGVGPLTVYSLFENLLKAVKKQKSER